MKPEAYTNYRAVHYIDGMKSVIDIPLGGEYTFTLAVNTNPFISIACSGLDLEVLAIGHLFSEGIIRSLDDVVSIDLNYPDRIVDVHTKTDDGILEQLLRLRTIASGCGQGTPDESVSIERIRELPQLAGSTILQCMKQFLAHSELHRLTHSVHSSALCDSEGQMVRFYDEIGRHNAIDKILGYSLQQGISLKDKMILSTGRMSSEIVYKCLRGGATVIVSRASPTTLSCDLARKHNLMMVGRIRANSFTIFNGDEYIN